ILDNTFDLTSPDGMSTMGVFCDANGANIRFEGNIINVEAELSDFITMNAPSNIRVLDNTIISSGRRFLYYTLGSDWTVCTCLVQGNDVTFTTPDPDNYRTPIEIHVTSSIVGNRIDHPGRAIFAPVGTSCS